MFQSSSRRLVFILLGSVLLLIGYGNCNTGGYAGLQGDFSAPSLTTPLNISGSEPNVVPMKIGCGNVDVPCVTVSVCEPGTNNCASISDVLVDTGSVGLRVFSSQTQGLHLQQLQDLAGHNLAECQAFADGTSDWGPVMQADVQMGNELASKISIQLIDDQNFFQSGAQPSSCTGAVTSASQAGYNGILGVGLFVDDCGTNCATNTANQIYFDCSPSSTNCQSTSVAVRSALQVSNPVASFPVDNNGVILQIPNVVSTGSPVVSGYLIFGIGTQSDNIPGAAVTMLNASSVGDFTSTVDKTDYTAFLDSGSNGLYFPAPKIDSIPKCQTYVGFYCPSGQQNLTATQTSFDGLTTVSVPLTIANADQYLAQIGFYVYNDIGGPFNSMFDWGLPFFVGRTIFVGLDKAKSSLGTGPYWAY